MVPLLSVCDLTIRLTIEKRAYPVVDGVSFDLAAGQSLAIVGESGCGKTMTGLSILRILPEIAQIAPESSIVFDGQEMTALHTHALRKVRGKRIAMIFQDPMSALNPVYTIGYQLREVVDLHLDLDEAMAEERILEALAEVGIASPAEQLGAYPHQISGGMKQRVMIAMALLCEPDLIIADEPTTALDVTVQAQILELLRRLQREKNLALILITHDMGVVAEMAERILVMYAGNIVEEGSVQEIFANPRHPYTQGLFASRIVVDTPRGALSPIKGIVPPITQWPGGCRFHPRCPYVMEKCRHGPVDTFSFEEGHTALCWLYEEET